MLAGVAWLGADWEGAQQGPAVLRSLGASRRRSRWWPCCTSYSRWARGRLRSPAAWAAIVAAYGIAAAVSVGHALFRDPLLDLYCWRNCRDNAFLVHADPGLSRALDEVWLWSALAIALGLIAFGLHRLLAVSGPGRRVLLALLAPAMLVGAAEAVRAVALLRTPLEAPTTPASPRSSSLARLHLRRSRLASPGASCGSRARERASRGLR